MSIELTEVFRPWMLAALAVAMLPFAIGLARHLLGLYHGRPRARAFRRHLSERAPRDRADMGVLEEAVRLVESLGATPLLAAE